MHSGSSFGRGVTILPPNCQEAVTLITYLESCQSLDFSLPIYGQDCQESGMTDRQQSGQVDSQQNLNVRQNDDALERGSTDAQETQDSITQNLRHRKFQGLSPSDIGGLNETKEVYKEKVSWTFSWCFPKSNESNHHLWLHICPICPPCKASTEYETFSSSIRSMNGFFTSNSTSALIWRSIEHGFLVLFFLVVRFLYHSLIFFVHV